MAPDDLDKISKAKLVEDKLASTLRASPYEHKGNLPPHNVAPQSPQAETAHLVQLPRLELPKFDGSHEHWHEFWDLFQENVHSRSDIGDATKMHLLRQHLKGDAFKSVQGLGNDGRQYSVAIQLLESQYGKSRATTMVLLKKLRLLQPSSSSSHAQASSSQATTSSRIHRSALTHSHSLALASRPGPEGPSSGRVK